jgi:hypothetical protein
MAQWMQCNYIQQTPTWADSVCSLRPDTHDGFDDESVRKKLREEEEGFKSRRDRLREVIARAYDPEHGKVAAEVQAIAAPYVERLESGAPRIDFQALERNKAVMDSVLAFQEALRSEYRARIERDNDDEDVMLLTALWN